jgi:TolA-binding protein
MATTTKGKGRLTKKELKQDKLVATAYKVEQYYLTHQRMVLGVAAAIIIVVVGIIFIRKSIQSSRLSESYQLTIAKMQYGSGSLSEAKDAFMRTVSTGGSRAAAEAKYFLGRIAFEQGSYAQAITEFEEYLKKYSADEKLDVACMCGLAASYEATNKFEDAAKTYYEVYEKYADNLYVPQALWDAQRLYRKINQMDKAIEILHIIRDKYTTSSMAQQAMRDLDALE